MISILTPTRGRPELLQQMVASADAEHLLYMDDDDPQEVPDGCRAFIGPRVRLGIAWNTLARNATGGYLMMGNDDLVFHGPWRERLEEEVKPHELKVACFNDGINEGRHFAFPIVTRAWYEKMGSFTAEIFNFGYHDTWIFDIAKKMDACVYIGDILVEHLHPTTGKRPVDQTFRERNWSGDRELFEYTDPVRQDLAKMMLS